MNRPGEEPSLPSKLVSFTENMSLHGDELKSMSVSARKRYFSNRCVCGLSGGKVCECVVGGGGEGVCVHLCVCVLWGGGGCEYVYVCM